MKLGIISDSHDELLRTQLAVKTLRIAGAEALIHCGDLSSPSIVAVLAVVPSWFAFGNHDSDSVPALHRAADEYGVKCLGWGGLVELDGLRIAITHGHMTTDIKRLLALGPHVLLTGHSHSASDEVVGSVRRINPGALHRAEPYTVALLDLQSGDLEVLRIDE